MRSAIRSNSGDWSMNNKDSHAIALAAVLRRAVGLVLLCLAASAAALAADPALPRLQVGDNGRFLVTADGKPFFWPGDTAWHMFNMIQTTTRFAFQNWETVAKDYARQPPKPTFDAEVAYEGSLSLRKTEPQDRRIGPWEVRRAAYWDVFAGGCGHTLVLNDASCNFQLPSPK